MAGKKIELLGPALKLNTDDMRDAPSLAHLHLAGGGAKVRTYDLETMKQAQLLMPEVVFHDDAVSAI